MLKSLKPWSSTRHESEHKLVKAKRLPSKRKEF